MKEGRPTKDSTTTTSGSDSTRRLRTNIFLSSRPTEMRWCGAIPPSEGRIHDMSTTNLPCGSQVHRRIAGPLTTIRARFAAGHFIPFRSQAGPPARRRNDRNQSGLAASTHPLRPAAKRSAATRRCAAQGSQARQTIRRKETSKVMDPRAHRGFSERGGFLGRTFVPPLVSDLGARSSPFDVTFRKNNHDIEPALCDGSSHGSSTLGSSRRITSRCQVVMSLTPSAPRALTTRSRLEVIDRKLHPPLAVGEALRRARGCRGPSRT